MKILYVKFNSSRAKQFQIKTIIFEENDQKLVKKVAMSVEAIPHLKKMKTDFELIAGSIVNPQLKLAKIVSETDDSLTFEYVEGASFKEKYSQTLESHPDRIDEFIGEYISLIKSSFRTKITTIQECDYKCKRIFGDMAGLMSEEVLCFSPGVNVDLIMSNLICKDDDVYIIDYEWIFHVEIPVDYVIYRALNDMGICGKEYNKYYIGEFIDMDKSFLSNYVYENSFNKYSASYGKNVNTIEGALLRITNHPITGPIIRMVRFFKKDKTFGRQMIE